METQTAQTATVVEEKEEQPQPQSANGQQQMTPVQLPAPSSMPEADLLREIVDETTKRHLLDSIVERRRLQDSRAMATYFADSGYFKDARSIAQAFTKIELGKCWGLNPAEAMKSVVFVNERPFCQNDAVAARLAEAGWSWKVQWLGAPPPKTTGCRLYLKYGGTPYLDQDGNAVTVEFTLDMASSIKVNEKGSKVKLIDKSGPWSDGWNFKMYYWKCIGLIRDFYAPNILSGARMQADAPEMDDFEPMDLVPVTPKEPKRIERQSETRPFEAANTANTAKAADPTKAGAQGDSKPVETKPAIITADQANQFFKVCTANGQTDEQMAALVKAGGADRYDYMRADLFTDVFKMAQSTYGPGKEPKK